MSEAAAPSLSALDPLVLATHNKDKLAELRAMVAPLGLSVQSAGELGLMVPVEDADSFEGNAALKAEAACRATGRAALADDSGLVVAALDGAPGIYTADWAGPQKDFAAAMARVLAGIGSATREATFVSVLALARPGAPLRFFEGRAKGVIAPAPRGTGYGYDPIFVPDDGDGRTFGEMSFQEKAGIEAPLSHRARSMAAFLAFLKAAA